MAGKLARDLQRAAWIRYLDGEPACPGFKPAGANHALGTPGECLLGTVNGRGKVLWQIPENRPGLDRAGREDDAVGDGCQAVKRRQLAKMDSTRKGVRQLADGKWKVYCPSWHREA